MANVKKTITKITPWALLAAMLTSVAYMLLNLESEVLFKAQEQSLWLPTETFWKTLNIYPGGGLSWLACYLTTFFYTQWQGVALLTLAWVAIIMLACIRFGLKGWNTLYAAVPVMMLIAAFTQTGYWIYYQKLPGHMWVPTLGVLISLLLTTATKGITELIGRRSIALSTTLLAIIMTLTAWFGYQQMGAWSFLAVVLMGLPEIDSKTILTKRNLFCTPLGFAILLVLIVPEVAYRNVFEQTIHSEIYSAAMPTFSYGQEDCPAYRMAYCLLAVSFLPMAYHKLYGKRINAVILITLTLGSAYFVHERWNRDKNFHAEIAMYNACDRNDWESALRTMMATASDTIAPTRAMVMMKNLALTRLGRAGDDMFLYPEGARQQSAEWTVRLTQIAGKLLYYNYGKLNFSYRWCMEDGVEFGWRVETFKFMARAAMLKGEDQVAHKFFDLLKLTRNHREWAEHYEQFIGQPEKMRADPELMPITYLKDYGNRLDTDNTLVEMYLLQTFANGHGADDVYQEQTLIAALLMKDIQLFWPRLFEYAARHTNDPNFHMPRYYQEAAYLYGHLEHDVDISSMPFDQSVKDNYDRFMAFNSQPHIAPLSEKEKAVAFKPMFGSTFYYFYFLVRGQKTN